MGKKTTGCARTLGQISGVMLGSSRSYAVPTNVVLKMTFLARFIASFDSCRSPCLVALKRRAADNCSVCIELIQVNFFCDVEGHELVDLHCYSSSKRQHCGFALRNCVLNCSAYSIQLLPSHVALLSYYYYYSR